MIFEPFTMYRENSILIPIIQIILLLCIGKVAFSQQMYASYWDDQVEFGTQYAIYAIDPATCEVENVFAMDNVYGQSIVDLAFHPNGRLYAASREGFLEIDPVRWQLLNFFPASDIIDYSHYHQIIFDEEGVGLISSDEDHDQDNIISDHHLYRYDFRNQTLLWDRHYLPSEFDQQILLNAKIGDLYVNLAIRPSVPSMLDLESLEYDTIGLWPSNSGLSIFQPALDYPYCAGHPALIGRLRNHFGEDTGIGRFVPATGDLNIICESKVLTGTYNYNILQATPTDFRRSPLRIDLDEDNSSGHIAGGYYDTLTTCRREVPLMDDVALHTCASGPDGEIDFISFRLKYFEQPLLSEEEIYSPDFPGELTRTAPDRYVWQNRHSDDEIKIKEYLQSLRYRAECSNSDQRERVVMTTMHVAGDSTTSWSVFQLETDDIFAGQDTSVTYCPGSSAFDLTDFLSDGIQQDGRFEPELADGSSTFIPGMDQDGEYRYILENENCSDTAVLTIQSLEHRATSIGLDTVRLCAGGRRFIGISPGQFDAIDWWDGSTGDSIWIAGDGTMDHFVEVSMGNCGFRIPIVVIEEDIGDVAGRDTIIRYCSSSGAIDIKQYMSVSADTVSGRVDPVLSGGRTIFIPGQDPDGEYLYIVENHGCRDTAVITFQKTEELQIGLKPIHTVCHGEDVKGYIPLPHNDFDSILWWNGDTTDATFVERGESWPLWVRAIKDGCEYRDTLTLYQTQPGILYEKWFSDTMFICDPEGLRVVVNDSIPFR